MEENEKKNIVIGFGGAAIAVCTASVLGGFFAMSVFSSHVPQMPQDSGGAVVATTQQAKWDGANATVGVIDYDRVMGEHPLIQEANNKMREKFEEMRAKIDQLPESERNAAWQQADVEAMEEINRNYVDVAKQSVDTAINEVMAKRGMTTLLNSTQLLRGGVDITNEVKAAIDKQGLGTQNAPR